MVPAPAEELGARECAAAMGNPALWFVLERTGAVVGRGADFAGIATKREALSGTLHLG